MLQLIPPSEICRPPSIQCSRGEKSLPRWIIYGDIHREALKTLPDKITTTSHYRYVLASFRREKDRLHEQIQSDRGLVTAMDAALDALKPFIDKGKGRDRG